VDIKNIHQVYFVGIGGIGMSALARYFQSLGKLVSGYDKTPTDLTDELIASGIDICFDEAIDLIPSVFKQNTENTLVVFTPAVPKNHLQLNYFIDQHFLIKKRAEVLGIITQNTFCYAVAGTHGKTTTSAILGHILHENNAEMTAFLGGIVENYQSNLMGSGTEVSVVEADEFDRSFLHLHPNVACVTSMDADHLDIYGDSSAIEASFREFAAKIMDRSCLFIPLGVPLEGTTLGIEQAADYEVQNLRIEKGSYVFNVQTPTVLIENICFGLPGRHNLMNALTALAMAHSQGVNPEVIKKALASFLGIRRRFSYQIKTDDLVYIDDYAHHPTEINAVHQAVRELYPNEKVLAVFQPHLFSRTRDFADDFAKSLSQFDEVLLMDIYPARELPMKGIDSEWLLSKMTLEQKTRVNHQTLVETIANSDAKIILTLGAGDIGMLVPQIKSRLNQKQNLS
jgi:UDP-N-acetylmuramate--alanine ligase